MNASTINGTTFLLVDSASHQVPGTVTYDTSSATATLTPTAALTLSTTYTATVKSGSSGVKDSNGNALAADFVWSFSTGADTTAPTVTSVSPLAGAAGVAATTAVNAVFSEAVNPSTVTGSTFQLFGPGNSLIAATVTYTSGSQTATLQPTAALASSTTYTAVVTGGSNGVKDLAGNALASNFTWSFTTAGTVSGSCPCSVWSASTTPGNIDGNDNIAIEVGVRFRSQLAGMITSVRFYKSAANTGTHTAHLWSNTGTLLGTATFAGETASGWQQADFATAIPISANITYVASYFAPNGHYSGDNGYFSTSTNNAPLVALQDGFDGVNGAYNYGSSSAFPASTFSSSNYWVDVVFVPTASTTPPTVTSVTPANNSTGVSLSTTITAVFSEPMTAATISGTTFLLVDSSGNSVPNTVTYNASTASATLTPSVVLSPATTYTVTVKGGSGGVQDSFGNTMPADFSSSFSTAGVPVNSGPGGPILVISSTSNPFSRYYGEILSAEGLNEYLVADISNVTSTTLAAYDLAILGDMSLTSAQVSMLTTWVNGGGRLIAMHPDKQLAGLLGLTASTNTLSNAYLLVQTSTGPGVGIVGQSIQFHGPADLYTLSGAASFATLYSSASTPTTSPAVTLANAGTGQAAAFTYDLARSIVYTRQGNPAWSGQARDGQDGPIRSDDLFFGAASFDPKPDWVDLNKVSIPQADEQQRLLGQPDPANECSQETITALLVFT